MLQGRDLTTRRTRTLPLAGTPTSLRQRQSVLPQLWPVLTASPTRRGLRTN